MADETKLVAAAVAAAPAAPAQVITFTPEQLAALIDGAVTGALRKAGAINRPAPSGNVPGVTCEVCGHRGVASDDGRCPNNNCPRNADAAIVGLHPSMGHPIRDAEEYKAAKADHAAAIA